MMAGKNRVGQIIEALVTVVTLIARTSWFRVVKATLDDVLRRTRGARNAIRPAQLADGLITLHIIDEMLDVDLHGWTPVRDRGMRFVSIHYPQIPRPRNPIRASDGYC